MKKTKPKTAKNTERRPTTAQTDQTQQPHGKNQTQDCVRTAPNHSPHTANRHTSMITPYTVHMWVMQNRYDDIMP